MSLIVGPKASFIGKTLLEYDTLDSTNAFLLEFISKSNPIDGTVVLAHHQTAGRGQYGRNWEVEPNKNLTLSILLHADFLNLKHQFYLTIITSLAIAELLEHYIKVPAFVKWPNDIYVGDRKICGVLIQNILQAKSIQYAIVGIGLNINQHTFNENLPNPTSIYREIETKQDLVEIRNLLFGIFEQHYLALKNGNYQNLFDSYIDRLYRKNVSTNFIINEQLMEGEIKGITSEGKLQIEIDGILQFFDNTEIKYIK